MNIVTNNIMMKYFKKIDLFKVDLGFNIKGPVNMKAGRGPQPSIKIRDEFIKKYQTLNVEKYIRKSGEIGSLKFYEDLNIKGYEFHIYDNENIFEIEATVEDLSKPPGIYLTEILKMLDGSEMESDESESVRVIKNVSYTNLPEEIIRPDMKLSKDDYIKAMIQRKNLLDKI